MLYDQNALSRGNPTLTKKLRTHDHLTDRKLTPQQRRERLEAAHSRAHEELTSTYGKFYTGDPKIHKW